MVFDAKIYVEDNTQYGNQYKTLNSLIYFNILTNNQILPLYFQI